MRCRTTYRSGMTLMEIVTVMVIILVLLSIMLPSVTKHKESVDLVVCSSNLHQMHVAYRSWLVDHPFAHGDRRALPRNWTGELTEYLHDYGNTLTCPSDEALAGNGKGAGGANGGANGGPGAGAGDDGGDVLAPPQGAGNVQIKKTMPANMRLHKVQSSNAIRVYKERSDYKLPKGLKVNMTKTGFRGGGQGKASTGRIDKETKVDVYLLHYDPGKGKKVVRNGRVTFGGEILGLITQIPTLNSSDNAVGKPKTKYYKGKYRGIEFSDDMITFEEDRMSLTVNYYRTPGWMEEMRVIVAPSEYTSYGMNLDMAGDTGVNTIMFSDYYKPLYHIADEVDDPYLQSYMDDPSTFPGRHFGRINALFYGGDVRLVSPEDFFDPQSDFWGADSKP